MPACGASIRIRPDFSAGAITLRVIASGASIRPPVMGVILLRPESGIDANDTGMAGTSSAFIGPPVRDCVKLLSSVIPNTCLSTQNLY